jgi:hypothetical protein
LDLIEEEHGPPAVTAVSAGLLHDLADVLHAC